MGFGIVEDISENVQKSEGLHEDYYNRKNEESEGKRIRFRSWRREARTSNRKGIKDEE